MAPSGSVGRFPERVVLIPSLRHRCRRRRLDVFDFVDSIAISISAAGLPDIEIARLQPVPGAASISIPPDGGVDLLPYINAGATIAASASGHMPVSDTTFAGKVVATVHV